MKAALLVMSLLFASTSFARVNFDVNNEDSVGTNVRAASVEEAQVSFLKSCQEILEQIKSATSDEDRKNFCIGRFR